MGYLTPDRLLASYRDLSPAYLKERGIDVLLMDIDNTLAPYEQAEPDERIKAWIGEMQAAGIGLAFVSNNNWERVELFNGEIGIPAFAKSGKPFGKTLRRVIKLYRSDAGHTAMLGDQLLTDVFAGKHIGATALLVPPIKDKTTAFWRIKRALERPVIRKYARKHPEQAACAAFWLKKEK
jgi:HAD superfamily phosphatase (TIGR01668 family)